MQFLNDLLHVMYICTRVKTVEFESKKGNVEMRLVLVFFFSIQN